MDTRGKILDAAQGRRLLAGRTGPSARVVVGWFDPLLASHAARLCELAPDGDGLLVAVLADPPEPLLAARARAELVAALAVVDYVVLAEGAGQAELLEGISPGSIFREEDADGERRNELVRRVFSRQKAARNS